MVRKTHKKTKRKNKSYHRRRSRRNKRSVSRKISKRRKRRISRKTKRKVSKRRKNIRSKRKLRGGMEMYTDDIQQYSNLLDKILKSKSMPNNDDIEKFKNLEKKLKKLEKLEELEKLLEELNIDEKLYIKKLDLSFELEQKNNKERQFLDYINIEDIIEYMWKNGIITENEDQQLIEKYRNGITNIKEEQKNYKNDDGEFKEIMESIIPNDITRYLIEKENEKLIEGIIEYMREFNQITEKDEKFIESYKTGKLGGDGEERFKEIMERIILYKIPQYLIEKEKEKEKEKENEKENKKFKGGSDTLQNGGQCGEDSELRAMIEQLQYAEHIWELDFNGNRAFDELGENFKRLQDRAFIHVYDITHNDQFKSDYIKFKVHQFDQTEEPGNIENMTTSPELIDNWKKYIHKRGDKFNNIQPPASRISGRGRGELERFKMTVTKTELINTENILQNERKYLLTTRSMHPMFVVMDANEICRNLNSQRRWLYNESIFYGIPEPRVFKAEIIGNIKNPGDNLENLEGSSPKWMKLDKLPYRASQGEDLIKIEMYAARLWSIELYGIYSSFTKIERNAREGDGRILTQYSLFKGALTYFIEKCSHYIPRQFFKNEYNVAFDNASNVRTQMGSSTILNETLKNVYNTIQKKHVKLYRGECRVFNKSFLIKDDKDFIPSDEAPKQNNTFIIGNQHPENYGAFKIDIKENGDVEFIREQEPVLLNNPDNPEITLTLDSFTATTPDINTAINFTSQYWCEQVDDGVKYIKVIYEYVNFNEDMCAYLGYFGIPSEHEVLFQSERRITVTNVVPHKRGNVGLEKLTATDVEGGIHGNGDIYLVVTCDCGA